jgi:hypothetical protein
MGTRFSLLLDDGHDDLALCGPAVRSRFVHPKVGIRGQLVGAVPLEDGGGTLWVLPPPVAGALLLAGGVVPEEVAGTPDVVLAGTDDVRVGAVLRAAGVVGVALGGGLLDVVVRSTEPEPDPPPVPVSPAEPICADGGRT